MNLNPLIQHSNLLEFNLVFIIQKFKQFFIKLSFQEIIILIIILYLFIIHLKIVYYYYRLQLWFNLAIFIIPLNQN